MAIETVAAGGGSICRFDGVKLVVGPESAGAEPGPACYGRGGPLTVTDSIWFWGGSWCERFPFPLDRGRRRRRLRELAAEAASPYGAPSSYSLEELAAGLVRIANANMAAAIRLVTVAKGADPADYVLVAFGSAAPQHACAVARELGIRQVLMHPDAGILSAVGIGLADVVRHRSIGVERLLEPPTVVRGSPAARSVGTRGQRARSATKASRTSASPPSRSLDLRYQGVDSYLTIPWPADGDFAAAFAAAHRQRYGYTHDGRPLEIAAARVEVTGRVASELRPVCEPDRTSSGRAARHVRFFDGRWQDIAALRTHRIGRRRSHRRPGHCQ